MNYKDPKIPIDQRVADLLSKMTLKEKIVQMLSVWENKNETMLNAEGDFDKIKAQAYFKEGLGHVARPSDCGNGKNAREMAELTNIIQKYFLEETRLGIPTIFHEECLHGHAANDGTHFSQPIGMAATFNPEIIQKVYQVTAEEARARGAHQALTPVLDVARDPRWGRVEETFGEDPYLVAQMGIAAVNGLQNMAPFSEKKNVAVTLKHYAAHGQPESGTNCAPVNVSMRVLREVFLYPFKKVIENCCPRGVMASYNEIDGIPSHANQWLLKDVLRDELGFNGVVVSDYYGITELFERVGFTGQYLARNKKEAAAFAVKAGVNIELPDGNCYPYLEELVHEGRIPENEIDELVAPLLRLKFELGLFEEPYVDPVYAEEIVGCDSHRKVALETALQTITLLKNENELAPLDQSKIKTLAVIGPNADRELLGGYSEKPKQFVTILDGIKSKVGSDINILYHEGCKITIGGSWWEDEVISNNAEEDKKSIAEAVKVAEKADAIVLVIGGNEQTSREAFAKGHMGDRTSLDLVGLQDELVNALVETGKPVVVFLFNGRPLSINNLVEKVPTIFECWYLGQEAGTAVAEVLFGDYNPGGKLPITIPRSVGHIPAYYNYKPAARRGYVFDEITPLFPFGYGLSYTQFEISDLKLEKNEIELNETVEVSVKIKNVGSRKGDEVVQLYIRDCFSSVTRPVKELKGFRRFSLDPQEEKQVTFEITPEHLAFYDIHMNYIVEPGEFEIMVGTSSNDKDLDKIILNVKGK